jgi:hypothetical protein
MRSRSFAPRLFVIGLLTLAAVACSGSNDGVPTPSPSSSSPTSSPTLSAAARRCLDDASFLTKAATTLEGLVQQAGLSEIDRSVLADVLASAQDQLTSVQGHAVRSPFTSPKATIIHGIQNVITGYQAIQRGEGTVGPGQASRALVSSGLNEIIAAQTDVGVKKGTCAG